jgi:hypothetical protein
MKKHLIALLSLIIIQSCSNKTTPSQTTETEILFEDKVTGPGAPGVKYYWQYRDMDGDGFGDGSNPDSVFFKKAKIGYAAQKGDCNDANSLASPAGIDICGIDYNCNGIESEGVPYWNYYYDRDADGYGNADDQLISCNTSVPGYVLNNTDCNDEEVAINPGITETLNDIDDNCDGQVDEGLIVAGLTITTSNVLIPAYMSAGGTNEMFANNDPNDAAWLTKIKTGNFGSWVHTEGHNSQWFRWHVPFGSKGNGFNPTKPAPCEIMNGDLCKSYSRDFNLSWLNLCTNTGGKPIYTCNISRGTLEELYYVIETRPDLKVIMYNQESSSGTKPALDSKTYPPKFYAWVDSVKKRFPLRELYHLADIPDIGGKKVTWTQDFINYKKLPSWICIRQYSHGFTKYTLTGKATEDSAAYTYAIKTTLPKQIVNVDSTFLGGGVFLSQFSTGVPGYAAAEGVNGNTVAVQGRAIDCMYYMRAEKVFVEAHRDGKWNLLGVNIIGLKNLMQSLDFKWLGVLNNQYLIPRYATTVTHSMGSQVDVLAGYANGEYCLIIQNRSGKEVSLPQYWNLDGRITLPTYLSGSGESCAELTSKTSDSFNPLTKKMLAPLSICQVQVK